MREIVAFLDEVLHSEIRDFTVNGLQVDATFVPRASTQVGFAVDSSLETFESARREGCALLCVHHGLIWGSIGKVDGLLAERLTFLLRHGISLYVAHLPLDAHQNYGHSAQIAQIVGGMQRVDTFYQVGLIAQADHPWTPLKLEHALNMAGLPVQRRMPFGPDAFDRVAICSGLISKPEALREAKTKGAQWILTGETNSTLFHDAKELRIGVLCCGHYATETFGMLALRELVKESFPQYPTVWIHRPTDW